MRLRPLMVAICLLHRMIFSLWLLRSKIRFSSCDGSSESRGVLAAGNFESALSSGTHQRPALDFLKALQRELSGVENQTTDTGELAPTASN